jgi:hypothetical protein
MSLYSISGIGCDDCESGYIGGRKERRARRQARRARRKARKSGINCKGSKVKSVVLSPARNAYLALIRLNVKKLAVKLAKATSTNEGRLKIHQRWCKLGGNASKLQSAIDKAYAKYKRKRGIIGYMDMDEYAAIGAEPTTTATILAAATPIILALAPLIKQFAGEKGADIAETAEELTETDQPDQQQPEENAEVGAIGINPWLVGGAALAAYFLFKKRK